ncbi:carbohydrate ABC transporter permease [Bifidobacterium bombi]|uniref:ABC transporter, permease protein n=1 Tax=Bifidobacterium bombi DSM 19703 TaxID=1341695 RepID=A0A080N3L2_9BIFI|nr:sugar ABC transporter permease [Bifidobacterium bombi]KFF31757.1 ABC transporter, permease protein [Bifidobacterium bombi DSM 19703]
MSNSTRKTKGKRSDLQRRHSAFGLACATPAVILFVIFMVIPTINVFRMSLYKMSPLSDDKTFVGLANFMKLATDLKFVKACQNTVLLLVLVTAITLPISIIFAAILTQSNIIGSGFLRFAMYIPSVLSAVVIAAIFSAIYDQKDGLLNGTLGFLGLKALRQVWLGNQKIVIYSIVFAMVWQAFGYYMVMYMSAMAGVSPELYEASEIDGAGKVRQLFTITIPLIWQNIRTTLTFFIISSVNMSFVLVTAMTNGGPDGASQTVLGYMYKTAYTDATYGYGMAIGVVLFLFSFLLSLIVNQSTKREVLQF